MGSFLNAAEVVAPKLRNLWQAPHLQLCLQGLEAHLRRHDF